MKTDEQRIKMAWNAGLILSKAFKHLNRLAYHVDKSLLIQVWRTLKKKYRCKSIPMAHILNYRYSPPTQRELDTPVSMNSPGWATYGEWKGITGPGRKLKQILKETNK